MTVKDLKSSLERFDDEDIVYVGCQGYSNFEDPDDEYVINIRKLDTKESAILIADASYYNELESRQEI